MTIFQNYLNGFTDVLEGKYNRDLLVKSSSLNESTIDIKNSPKYLLDLKDYGIESFYGKNLSAFDNISIGAHPDFSHIKINEYLLHHCTSVFIDIKGSTKLIRKYTLMEVRLIKDSLLTLVILIANKFGGHTHRLQGDGVFVQFARRDNIPNDTAINALNMTSLLVSFVSNELAQIMEERGIAPIKIRIGIDFGKDDHTLWSYYGIPGCNELTTTSLHTDMAAKLQAKAKNNSIIIGGNVVELLDLRKDYLEFYNNGEKDERVYNITSDFSYPLHVFNWKKYLTLLPFFNNDSQKPQFVGNNKEFSIQCTITNKDDLNEVIYFPNSYSMKKGTGIKFTLLKNNTIYQPKEEDIIKWTASNSGIEAQKEEQSEHNFDGNFDNLSICKSTAAYKGHHLLLCELKRKNNPTVYLQFPIFVQ